MNNDWFTKDRSETASNRMPEREIQNGIKVINAALGINIYRNAMSKDLCDYTVKTLEENLNGKTRYRWNGALITSSEKVVEEARNCLDFKVSTNNLGRRDEHNADLYDMHQKCFEAIFQTTEDYGSYWGVGVRYFESFNFVKYDGPGTHFKIHADHGPAYVSTISVVAYLNDDYKGGEIYFPRFDLTIKPQPGDIVVFPSTYIYEHASQPMIEGTKYSIVVMTDYNDREGHRSINYQAMDHSKITY
jgi:hypothetical protein